VRNVSIEDTTEPVSTANIFTASVEHEQRGPRRTLRHDR
jgi:hypothetical protein